MAVDPVVLLNKCQLYDCTKSDEEFKSILYSDLGILSPKPCEKENKKNEKGQKQEREKKESK